VTQAEIAPATSHAALDWFKPGEYSQHSFPVVTSAIRFAKFVADGNMESSILIVENCYSHNEGEPPHCQQVAQSLEDYFAHIHRRGENT